MSDLPQTSCSCAAGSRCGRVESIWLGPATTGTTCGYLSFPLCIAQVFQSFIDGFGAYGPLLSRIKQVFDQAIEDGLKDALENSKLRQQLLEARREQAAAEAAGRAEVIDGEPLVIMVRTRWLVYSHLPVFHAEPDMCA